MLLHLQWKAKDFQDSMLLYNSIKLLVSDVPAFETGGPRSYKQCTRSRESTPARTCHQKNRLPHGWPIQDDDKLKRLRILCYLQKASHEAPNMETHDIIRGQKAWIPPTKSFYIMEMRNPTESHLTAQTHTTLR